MVKTTLELNGRTVVDAVVEGIDLRDYPDFCDAYFESAFYEDGTALSDNELEELGDQHPDALHEMAYDSIY
jgi:predicted NAD/FAD-binding protein